MKNVVAHGGFEQYRPYNNLHFWLPCSKLVEGGLDKSAEQLSEGLMRTLGRFTILGNAPLRAMLAVLFLVMSALQPGLFATANATGFHAGVHLQAETAAHDMGDHGATADDADTSEHHHGAKQSADKSCEAHCAPANAVPVDCPDLEHVVSRCFAPVVAVTLPLGEYTALIRPPKHLN
ncbi:hypothetical protein [Mesorhizobium sp.]|uniref:hypothetical protein n=1 Tax=Mesorhizobium sp. TaxID=1871066 RepID=UPI000FE50AC8|nr:hypothetical protein [Mesorhizobium sp.]RWP79049.1 MAG: hypothetical protein EOR09_04500 [Mesorhizobium sp.]